MKSNILLFAAVASTAAFGTVRWDGGRMLVEEGESKELKVEDNVAWLEAGKVPKHGVGNVIRWLEFNHVDCTRFRERYKPVEPAPGEPLAKRPGFHLGFMLDVSRDKMPKMETLKRLVDALAAFGYNEFQLYTETTFAYEAHPEMWRDWSPMTAAEVSELDDYCWKRGIVLTPNQNSFGHLEKLFRHARYRSLAEVPEKFSIDHPRLINHPPAALCATDPKSLDFVGGLYDEILPLFKHADRLHVGCDEVWDIFAPNARSAAKAAAMGVSGVYTDYLLQVSRLCRQRKRRMMFWADMMFLNFDRLGEIPTDSLPINWGYGGEDQRHPGYTCEVEGRCLALKLYGLQFYVAPSDNVYGSYFGRFRRAKSNIDLMTMAGRKYGACGLLLTCWGDGGFRAPWISSLPAIVYTAAKVRGEDMSDAQVADAIDRHLGCRIGATLVALGNLADPNGDQFPEEKPTKEFEQGAKEALAKSSLADCAPWIRAEYDTLVLGSDRVSARVRGDTESHREEFARRFTDTWLRENRPGGLRESLVGEQKLPVPNDLAERADDAVSGPVLKLTASVPMPPDVKALTNYSAVVIDGRLNIKPEQAQTLADALVDYVRAGGGLAWIHPYFPEFRGADFFLQMVAGSTRGTPWTANGTWRFLNERPSHPVNAAFRDEKASFSRSLEVPMLTSFYARHRCDVLISVDLSDETTRKAERDWLATKGSGEARLDNDYAVSWTRRENKGRIFCTAFAPTDPILARHITDGIRFVRGTLPEPTPVKTVAWRAECRLDWANGIWHEGLAAKAKALEKKRLDFVIFGDSITEFWGSPAASPQKGGKEVWERRFGAFGDRAQAFGMAGDRTENVLWRVTEGGEADSWTAPVIFLMVGINNRMCRRSPGARPDTPEETARGTIAVARALQMRHPESKIVVLSILPTTHREDADWIRQCNRLLARTEWVGNIVFRDIGESFLTKDGQFDTTLFRDGVHPNFRGYERFADAMARELPPKSLRVLMIGNSFSICVGHEMPRVAKAMGFDLDLASLYIGGCSLERHWNNWIAATNVHFRPYRLDRWINGECATQARSVNIQEALSLGEWDVITFQQASHDSWRLSSYQPFANDLQAAIRARLPKAELVWQETWSYTPWDGRLKKWGVDQNEMYASLHRAYTTHAAESGQRIIPTGTAIQFWRASLPVKYTANSTGGDVVGRVTFKRQPDGTFQHKGDPFHLNPKGEYLQALVWTAKLFGADVTKCPYEPACVTPREAELMKQVAMRAVREQSGLNFSDIVDGRTDRAIPIYSVGEEMTFKFALRGFAHFNTAGCTFDWERTGDDGKRMTGKAPADHPLILKTSLDRPGFVRYHVELHDAAGKPVLRDAMDDEDNRIVRFDGGAGADIFDIRPAVPEPADFEAFWSRMREKLAATPWKDAVKLAPVESGRADVKLYTVSVPCPGGHPATGFLTIPIAAQAGKRFPADISFFGYGGSWSTYATQKPAPSRLRTDVIQLLASAHGFELMQNSEYYQKLRREASSGGCDYAFDARQNADPEKAYFHGMSLRVMRALEFLKSRPEWNGRDLMAHGGSMGGLQAIWAAALDPAVTRASVEAPWCCDIGGTEKGRNRGDWYVKWVPALGYYDPVNMARRIPAHCTVELPRIGLGDYICPPIGIMSFYNSLTCPKSGIVFQNTRHGYRAPEPLQKFALDGARARSTEMPSAPGEDAANYRLDATPKK